LCYQHTADGRAVHVSATSFGRRVADQVTNDITIPLNALAADLSAAERRTLATLAGRIVSAHAPPAA
jgi:DNA-binding MarR family transcriptional regulator